MFFIELIISYLLYFSGIYWIRRKMISRRGGAVVLVYHGIGESGRGPGRQVTARSLEKQMRCIKDSFIPSTWEEIRAEWGGEKGLRVLVTFDDARREIFSTGIQLLEKYGIPAIFFAPTDFLFGRIRLENRPPEKGRDIPPFPSGDDIRRAVSSPLISFGNHTASHSITSHLSEGEFLSEIRSSQGEFQKGLGIRPVYFAYPRGRKGDILENAPAILKNEGFESAFTMIPGLVSEKSGEYMIPRIGVSHVNDMILFKVKTAGLLSPLIRLRNALSG